MDATNATDLIKVGKVPEPGDKSEDLPKIHSLAFAPRIGRVRQMSETVSDSTEPKRSYSPCSRKWKSACGVEIVRRFLTPINNRLNRIVTELLFDSNTCLMAVRLRTENLRISVTGIPQNEWGGREVSPSYRKYKITR